MCLAASMSSGIICFSASDSTDTSVVSRKSVYLASFRSISLMAAPSASAPRSVGAVGSEEHATKPPAHSASTASRRMICRLGIRSLRVMDFMGSPE